MQRFATLFITLILMLQPALAGDIISDGLGHHGVVLDVLFTYEPEDENLQRWESVFQLASNDIHRASSGEVYIKKVNFIVCPFEIEEGKTKGTADVVIRRNPGRNSAKGTLSGSRPGGVVFFDQGRPVDEDGEAMGHELAHYLFEIYDEYKQPNDDEGNNTQAVLYRYDQLGPNAVNLQSFFSTLAEEGVVTLFDYDLDEGARLGALFNGPLAFTVSNDLTSTTKTTRLNFRQFCSAPLDEGQNNTRACIMDAGSRIDGNLVKLDYYGLLCTATNHSTGVATKKDDERVVIWSRNGQSSTTGRSCASVAKDVWLRNFTIFLKLQGTAVGGAAPEIEVEKKTNCSETVVLLLDKSGSMDGARIANLKSAAMGLIDSLDDSTKLGIVWFDSTPTAAVGIQELKDNRELAKQAISPISAGGGTAIAFGLGVAYQQLVLLWDPDMERPDEKIYLITDGVSQDDPTTVLQTIRSDGVTVESVAIGEDADTTFLQEAAFTTGGTFYSSPDDDDIVRVVTQGTTESLEGYSLVTEESFDTVPVSIDVPVDAFTKKLLVQLEMKDVDLTDLGSDDFSLRAPDGSQTPAFVRFAPLDGDNVLVTFVLNEPTQGVYSIQLPGTALRASSTARMLQLVQSNELRLFANLNPTGTVEYPQPVVIKAGVEGHLGSAHGVPISATVRRPDGSEVVLQLQDNGNRSDGDELSNDGVAAATFMQFNQDGTYTVDLVADNSGDQAVIGGGMHGPVTEEKFGAFVRRKALTFEVANYSAPPSGSLTLSKAIGPSLSQLFSSRLLPQGALVVANFHAQTGAGQGVVIEELDLDLSGELVDLANFGLFELYIDQDQDGLIDFVGETASPIGRAKPVFENGKVSLRGLATLPADSDVDLLLVGYYTADLSIDQDSGLPLNAGWPLSLLLLSTLWVGVVRKRRAVVCSVALSVFSLAILGCGSQDDFVFQNSTPSVAQESRNLELVVGNVRSELSLDSIVARGQIDGQPVSVGLPVEALLKGPEITVESQVLVEN